jgi:hypothetical protein
MDLAYYYQNIVFLHPSDEADTGSGGDQPARNTLMGWNRMGRQNILPLFQKIFFPFQPFMPKKTHYFEKVKNIK